MKRDPFLDAVGFGGMMAGFGGFYAVGAFLVGELRLYDALALPAMVWVYGGLLMFFAAKCDEWRREKRNRKR